MGDPVIGTFKKLSFERQLGFYFSLLTSLVFKWFSDQGFKWGKLKKSFKRCFFSKGTVTTSVLSACQMFAKCVDDPQVQKCVVRIKTAKQITAISYENRAKNWKKNSNNNHEKRKIN